MEPGLHRQLGAGGNAGTLIYTGALDSTNRQFQIGDGTAQGRNVITGDRGITTLGPRIDVRGNSIGVGADGIAALLNISARTLHRQLKEEGASLQALKDEVRFERAKDLLNRSDKPVKQVATAAGLKNEKSFIRAFRQWAGMPPMEFRARHHA